MRGGTVSPEIAQWENRPYPPGKTRGSEKGKGGNEWIEEWKLRAKRGGRQEEKNGERKGKKEERKKFKRDVINFTWQ